MARSKNITIHVPRELRAYCEGASELMLSAPSVRAVSMNWSGDILRCTVASATRRAR